MGVGFCGGGSQNATQKKVMVLLDILKKYVSLIIYNKHVAGAFMSVSKNIYQETVTTVDMQTGEISAVEKTNVVKLPAEPAYVKLYLDDIQKLYDLPNNTILYELLKRMNYEGEVVLNSSEKKKIAAKLSINVQTIDNYLTKLKSKDLFKSVETGTYIPNPNLFGKGEWLKVLDRRKKYDSIKLNVTYTESGLRSVKTEFDEVKQNELDL